MDNIKRLYTLFKHTIKSDNGCWEYTRCSDRLGYGISSFNGKPVHAHRVIYIILNGPLTREMYVCHSCDNRKCINPEHLFVGTAKDNTYDMLKKGRGKSGRKKSLYCKRGHVYTEETIYISKKGRSCKVCSEISRRKRKAKRLQLKVSKLF